MVPTRMLVAVFATVFATGVLRVTQAGVLPEGGHIQNLYAIGNVEGKQFFYENSTIRNWADASAYCQAANMELGSLETRVQTDFVVSGIQKLRLGQSGEVSVWTSGRLNTGPESFRWSSGGSRVDENAIRDWTPLANQCIFFALYESELEIGGALCNEKTHAVLCQLKN